MRETEFVSKSFAISWEDGLRFAELSSDFGPLHVDKEFSRTTRFRAPLIHGVLPICVILENLCKEAGSPFSLKLLRTEYLEPIYYNQNIFWSGSLKISESSIEFEGFLQDAGTKNKMIQCTILLTRGKDISASTTRSLFKEKLTPIDYDLDSLLGVKETANVQFSKTLCDSVAQFAEGGYFPLEGLCLLALSGMGGSKLPGKYGASISFTWDRKGDPFLPAEYEFSQVVTSTQPRSQRIDQSFEFKDSEGISRATGTIKSYVGRKPSNTIFCNELKKNYLDWGLAGKVVLVTGSSRGIGAATAKLFSLFGARVVFHYWQGQQDAMAALSDVSENGGTAIALQADIREENEVTKLCEAVIEKWGKIDVLVNNAVHDYEPKALSALQWADFQNEIDVSLKGMHHLCKTVLPGMRKQGSGKIINLAALISESPVTGHAKDITLKNAVLGYTKSLALELARENIQVNAVLPAMTDTSLNITLSELAIKRINEENPCNRLLQPAEVAQAVVFLASSWSNNMSGQRVVLNQGQNVFI